MTCKTFYVKILSLEVNMKYSIEIGKIIEGALKRDNIKVKNYLLQLINKLEEDKEEIAANKFKKLLYATKFNELNPIENFSSKNVPVDNESRMALIDIIYPNNNSVKTILNESIQGQIKEFIQNYKMSDKIKRLGFNISNSLLLYGPPGCGKTNTAYMIAKELNLPLVITRLDSLISSYLGTTAKNIRQVFEFADKFPCVLFLDEFDAIAKARDDVNELGELKRVVNSLLQNIDNLNKDCVVIAATNHEQLLDTAVWRRFDYKLKLDIPDVETIYELVPLFLKNTIDLSKKEIIEISTVLYGKTGSQIEDIINRAIKKSVLEEKQLSKLIIYEQIFLYEGLTKDKLNSQTLRAQFLREKQNGNKKIFTMETIGEILGLSKGQISNILKEDNNEAR